MRDNFFIITGGPGSGKTTLLEEFMKRRFFCVEDIARKTIQEEVASGGDALPWKNLSRFIERLIVRSIETYKEAAIATQEAIFFDMGALEYVAYAHCTQTQIPSECITAARSLVYNRKVFIAPPWKEIFCNDSERTQTFEHALKVYSDLVKAYSEYGYEIIELPKTSVEKRADFVINHM